MTDYYLQDRSRLKGQPKKTIGDYVESKGILVPKRFNSFDDAKKSGLPIIARSEHPQEYDGLSGLLESPRFNLGEFKEIISEEEFFPKSFVDRMNNKIKCYNIYLHQNESQLKKEISFSYWELLGGTNHIIIADSAIPERYHITCLFYFKEEHERYNRQDARYYLVEKGKIILENSPLRSNYPQLRQYSPKDLEELVLMYEKIRTFENFDAQHCPLMEFQTVNDLHYFLQYHRTRDVDYSSFIIERKAEEGEIEALFVRGKTSHEGMIVKTTVVYADYVLKKPWEQWRVPPEQEASLDLSYYNWILDETMQKMGKARFIDAEVDRILLDIASRHRKRSFMFKPELSLIIERERLITEEERNVLYECAKKTGEDQTIFVQVISDGRKAYVKRI